MVDALRDYETARESLRLVQPAQAAGSVDLTIVIPAYNEERRLPATLERLMVWASERPEKIEIVVVDDGSTDATAAVAARYGPPVKVLRLDRNSGKGAAVKAGVLASAGTYVLVTDADLSTPIEEYDRLLEAVDGGSAVAIGSRAVHGSRVEAPQPWRRRLMGQAFNRLVQALVLPGLHDTQCGFKLFSGVDGREIFGLLTTRGFAFDVEALVVARSLGHSIAEVPVEWWDSPDSRVQPLRDPARMLVDLLQIRRRARRRRPNVGSEGIDARFSGAQGKGFV